MKDLRYWKVVGGNVVLIVGARSKGTAKRIGKRRFNRGEASINQIDEAEFNLLNAKGAEVEYGQAL